jgi:hypothetical protein
MKRLVLLLLITPALADPLVTVTPRPGRHELFDSTGKLLGTYDTAELCAAQITANVKEGKTEWKCKAVTHYTSEAKCAPEPEVIDAEGYKVLKALPEPAMCPDGIQFEISGPVWEEKPFPVCGGYVVKVLHACGEVPDVVAEADMDDPGLPLGTVGTDPPELGESTWSTDP